MDEADLLLINKSGYVVTKEGSKGVYKLKSKEKVENIMAMVYCDAEGNFLSLPCASSRNLTKRYIWKTKKCPLLMSKNASYVKTNIFYDWLKNHLFPRKFQGTCIFLLDRHTSLLRNWYTH